jgi:hypothetical protein
MTIVNDDSSIVIKCSFKLIDDARVVIYDRHVFIVQPTGVSLLIDINTLVLNFIPQPPDPTDVGYPFI